MAAAGSRVMMSTVNEIVGVVVPMYNGAATIAETLESVCAQTYRALDIVVVDDGSTDNGSDLVSDFAQRDPRIRLIRQTNAGVAAARNRGASETAADYLAFIDADDLWAPDKIALQMELVAGREPALVYCWFSHINEHSHVYPVKYEYPQIVGDVRRFLARENFVGNGSSMLVPREVFESTGGFSSLLREHSAEGCEDYMFALAAALHYPFKMVPRYLVGYRTTPSNMSSNADKMIRSFELVVEQFRPHLGEFEIEFVEHHRDFLIWHARRAMLDGRHAQARALIERVRLAHGIELAPLLGTLGASFVKSKVTPQWSKSLAKRLGLISRPRYLDCTW
jgi:glycosyltransferase involved in cell wall biosynthesis